MMQRFDLPLSLHSLCFSTVHFYSPTMVNVLVLGGHGKIALQITRLLAASNHVITSVIRDASQTADILATAPSSRPDLVKPLVSSLEETPPEKILQQLEGIDWVVWSAGIYT